MLARRGKAPGSHLPAADESLESGVVRATGRHGAATSARPRVSVVIPCYNYAQFLDDAIRSALDQAGVEVDVTIVDDGSTDGSLRTSREWAERDSRVRVIVHQRNMGHIATFNHALEAARSPYVVKLDPDDLLTADSLQRSAAVLDANPDVSFVYGYSVPFEGDPPTLKARRSYFVRRWTGERWIWRRAAGGVNVIRQPEVMIRTSVLRIAGGHRAEVPEASDYHLWLRLASTGRVARIRGPVQGLYRIHAMSMQHTIHAGVLRDLRARLRAFELFLDERGFMLKDAESMRRLIHRTFAREALLRALDSYDAGTADSDPIDEFRDLARSLDPGITTSRRWRELRHREMVGPAESTPRLSPSRFFRQIRWNHRIRWMRRYQK